MKKYCNNLAVLYYDNFGDNDTGYIDYTPSARKVSIQIGGISCDNGAVIGYIPDEIRPIRQRTIWCFAVVNSVLTPAVITISTNGAITYYGTVNGAVTNLIINGSYII